MRVCLGQGYCVLLYAIALVCGAGIGSSGVTRDEDREGVSVGLNISKRD